MYCFFGLRFAKISSVPEPVPQIHASSAMPSTLDAQSVHQCVMRLLDLATTLAKTLEDGGESGQLRQGGWDGAHHPPPPMSMRPSNTSSANSSRLLTENDVNSPPANNLRPDEPASINTPVSEQVDERSDTTVGGDGQHLKKRRRVDEVGSSQLNPRAHSNFSSSWDPASLAYLLLMFHQFCTQMITSHLRPRTHSRRAMVIRHFQARKCQPNIHPLRKRAGSSAVRKRKKNP
jgi:hypothetical protein